MPRRKTLTLDLDSLKCGDQIYQLLFNSDELVGYDLSTVKVTIQEDIETKIKDLDKVIKNLERYMAINPNYSDVANGNNLVKKQTLAKMLGVSRVVCRVSRCQNSLSASVAIVARPRHIVGLNDSLQPTICRST